MSVLADAPLGFANARNPMAADPGLGALTDPLPDLRLSPAPKGGMKGGELAALILGALGDGMRGYAGQAPLFTPAMMQQRQSEAEEARWRERLAAQLEADKAKVMSPRVEQVGNTVGWLDPSASSYEPIFTAPQPFELYARSLGHQPGSPEYIQAIEDYRAGTWGDEGVAGRLTVQQPRLDQSNTNNLRSTGVSRENNIRSTSTSRGNNLRSTAQSNINSERTAETTRGSASYQGRGKGAAPRAVAANGEPIVVKGGRWVYEKTGQPVN
nr:J435 [uncultured bacterium]